MEKHYWIILFDDSRYLELYGTEQYVDEWLHTRMSITNDKRSYRKVIWDD